MSAFVARLAVEVPAGGRHGFLPGVRRGAGHENTGSDFASDGEEDYPAGGLTASASGRCGAGTGAIKNFGYDGQFDRARATQPQTLGALETFARKVGRCYRTEETATPEGCGKLPVKTTGRFPTAFRNPATPAGFPLSHNQDGGEGSTLTWQIKCYKNRTF